jgi:transposase
MVKGVTCGNKPERFAVPPWTKESTEWLAIDQRLPADHLARRVERAVQMLDLSPLFASYFGVGKKALPPDLLLKAVLYEMHSKRPSPAQWAKDVRESESVRWLLFGLQPSRARLYDFRERLAPFWLEWNAQVLHVALEENLTPARRVALDSSSVAAHASRRHLLNEERLQKRREVIDDHLQRRQQGETVLEKPGWLAETEVGLRGGSAAGTSTGQCAEAFLQTPAPRQSPGQSERPRGRVGPRQVQCVPAAVHPPVTA